LMQQQLDQLVAANSPWYYTGKWGQSDRHWGLLRSD
jgi:hypothetical protein